jgi:hypothetical protein
MGLTADILCTRESMKLPLGPRDGVTGHLLVT